MLLLPLLSHAVAAEPARQGAVAAERFDVDLRDAEIHSAILLFAEMGNLDVVIPDSVHGTVTIRLRHVTWETALGALLANEGLAAVHVGDAVRISPL